MATEIIKHSYAFKRGTEEAWKAANPILLAGEPGVVIGGSATKLKIGDGFTPWNALSYIGGDSVSGMEIQSYTSYADLPQSGNSNKLYLVTNDSLLYQWNGSTYIPLAKESVFDPTIINLINGGNANG